MRVLVTGSRYWDDYDTIYNTLKKLGKGHVLIHGMAPGADGLAAAAAADLGWEIEGYPALWNKYGRAAGPIRNQQMLDEGRPEYAIAFHEDLSKSRGTADMIKRVRKAGLPLRVIEGKK